MIFSLDFFRCQPLGCYILKKFLDCFYFFSNFSDFFFVLFFFGEGGGVRGYFWVNDLTLFTSPVITFTRNTAPWMNLSSLVQSSTSFLLSRISKNCTKFRAFSLDSSERNNQVNGTVFVYLNRIGFLLTRQLSSVHHVIDAFDWFLREIAFLRRSTRRIKQVCGTLRVPWSTTRVTSTSFSFDVSHLSTVSPFSTNLNIWPFWMKQPTRNLKMAGIFLENDVRLREKLEIENEINCSSWRTFGCWVPRGKQCPWRPVDSHPIWEAIRPVYCPPVRMSRPWPSDLFVDRSPCEPLTTAAIPPDARPLLLFYYNH